MSIKLCFILPILTIGGMEKVMINICNFIGSRYEFEIHLVLLIKSKKIYKISENIIFHEPDFEFKKNINYIFKVIIYLRFLVRKIEPYSILSFGEKYNNLVLLSTIFLPTKVYVSDRSKPDKNWGIFHNFLRKVLYPKASGIISQTSYSKSFLQKETGHTNVVIIPNPVNQITFFHPIIAREKVILTVGRLIKSKRIDLLLDIFESVKTEGWVLWIVGDGPEREFLEERVRLKKLDDKVTFWGNQLAVNSFYQKAGIFAFTSESEGFPNALLEASAFGLPCISFDCIAGPRDIIEHTQSGFLIEMYDVKRFTNYLKQMMEEEQLRKIFGQRAIEKSKKYNMSIIGEAYLNLLVS